MYLQRQARYLFPLFVIVGLVLTSQSQGFIPIDEDIVVTTVKDSENSLIVGTIVEISVIVKNFFNSSISNITLTQVFPKDLTLVESPYGTFSEAKNYTLGEDNLSILDTARNINVSLNYLNVTANNFTMNLEQLAAYDLFSFSFKVNMSSADDQIELNPIRVTYFDKWGDPQTVSGGNPLLFVVTEESECERCPFFPEITVDDNDRNKILFIAFGTILVVVLSRMLHFKKPMEI